MTEKKKHNFSIGVVLLAAVLGVLCGALLVPRTNDDKLMGTMYSPAGLRMSVMMQIIGNYYVDDIDQDSLSTIAIQSMLSSLDPHSTYLAPADFDKEVEILQGRFEGIGVTLKWVNDTVYALDVHAGSPAAHAGVQPGDRIIKVDTVQVSGVKLEEGVSKVVELIRGPRYSTVTLTLDRKDSKTPLKIKIKRDVIRHSSVPAAVMINKTTGYIRVSHFAETTASEFHNALLQLNKQGMKHLVLDLRGNGGGSLESAVKMADELLPKGDMIVYTQGAHSRRHNSYATSGGLFEEGQLTILINEFSASASEVVSGAIQDNDRGLVAGRCSFGKGLVQRQFDLPDGDAVMLTIARYYSPSGRCIQRPYDKGSDAYYTDYLNRIFSNFTSPDSLLYATADTTQQYLTKKGRKVYGGGGIQPDITLPYVLDTNWAYYNQLLDKQVLDEVMCHQLHDHYPELMAKYPTADHFVKNYQIDNDSWQRILNTGAAKGVKPRAESLKRYANHIRNHYKALMAAALYDENTYYRVSLRYDNELQKIIK
jgi:carboxyl-terminal processing protease